MEEARARSRVSWATVVRAGARAGAWALAGVALTLAVVPVSSSPHRFGEAATAVDDDEADMPGQVDYSGLSDVNLDARMDPPTFPVAVVPADSPRYWRGGVLSDYDGHHVAMATRPISRLVGSPSGGTVAVPAAAVLADRSDDRVRRAEVRYDVRPVTNPATEGLMTMVIMPGPASTVSVPAADSTVTVGWGANLLLRTTAGYAVTAAPWPTVAEAPPFPERGGAQVRPGLWLAQKAQVTARTRELARSLTAGHDGVRDKILAVESYLSATYSYDLHAPVAPPDADSVDYFLFTSRRGFCVHFATAEMVLLRSVGIPARLATGYAGGTTDPQHPGDRTITADRAHAWVEAEVPGTGWAISDPTPAGAVASRTRPDASPLGDLLALAGWAGAVATVAVTAGLYRRARRRRWGPAAGGRAQRVAADDAASRFRPWSRSRSRYPEVEDAYRRFAGALADAATPCGPGETLSELGERVPRARAALAVVARSRYDPRELPSSEQRAAIAALESAGAAIRGGAPDE